MTKIQKILIGLFIAMVAMPEILWSPILKFWIGWNQPTVNGHYQVWRENFLDNNSDLWSKLLSVQLIGIVLTTIYLLTLRRFFKNALVFWTLFVICVFVSIFIFYMHGFSTIKITL
jgi:hypothetical protein